MKMIPNPNIKPVAIKKMLLLFFFMAMPLIFFAQVPQAIKYQAVTRGASGSLLVNQTLQMRISILQNSMTGPTVYSEIHTPTSNQYGLVNLDIGTGDVENGDFSLIDWSLGPYFIQVEADETMQGNFQLLGISQLMSVPYALYAAKSGDKLKAGSGLTITNDTLINTAPDKPITITGAGATTVSGTYPDFTISSTGGISSVTPGTGLSLNGAVLNSVWSQNLTDIYNNNTGAVGVINNLGVGGSLGVGTFSPGYKFTVVGGDIRVYNSDNAHLGFRDYYLDLVPHGLEVTNTNMYQGSVAGMYNYPGYSSAGVKRAVDHGLHFTAQGYANWHTWNPMMTITELGKVGIGTFNPSQKLEVTGAVKIGDYVLPATDGTAGQFFATNGAGTVSWTSLPLGMTSVNPLSFTPTPALWTLKANSTVVFQTGTALLIQAYYSATVSASNEIVSLKLTYQDGFGPETPIAYSRVQAGPGTNPVVNPVLIYRHTTALTNNSNIIYKLYVGTSTGVTLSEENCSLVITKM